MLKSRALLAALAATTALSIAPLAASLADDAPVSDPLGVVKIEKGNPIVLGAYSSQSGPDTPQGIDEQRGMEIAFSEAGDKILDHPIKLISEDSQCTAEGGQETASKLAANPDVVVVLGPSCSSVARAGAPILWNASIASIGVGASNPALTASDRPAGFEGFLRVVPNDQVAGAFAAKYAYQALGARKAATLHDGTPYTQGLVSVFEAEFKKYGGAIVAGEAVSPDNTDMRPVLTQLTSNKPDVLYAPLYVQAAAFVARQSKEIPGMKGVPIVGSESPFTPSFLTAAGDSAIGFKLITVSTDAFSSTYPAFVEKYKDVNGEAPTSGYAAYGHDAAALAIKAILSVAKTDADGNTYIGRKALRDALFATKDLPGLTGTLTCTQYGDCGASSYVALEFTNGDANKYVLGTNPKQVYP